MDDVDQIILIHVGHRSWRHGSMIPSADVRATGAQPAWAADRYRRHDSGCATHTPHSPATDDDGVAPPDRAEGSSAVLRPETPPMRNFARNDGLAAAKPG